MNRRGFIQGAGIYNNIASFLIHHKSVELDLVKSTYCISNLSIKYDTPSLQTLHNQRSQDATFYFYLFERLP